MQRSSVDLGDPRTKSQGRLLPARLIPRLPDIPPRKIQTASSISPGPQLGANKGEFFGQEHSLRWSSGTGSEILLLPPRSAKTSTNCAASDGCSKSPEPGPNATAPRRVQLCKNSKRRMWTYVDQSKWERPACLTVIPGPRNSKLREKGADRTPLWNLGDQPSNRNRLLNKETVDQQATGKHWKTSLLKSLESTDLSDCFLPWQISRVQ